MMSSFRRDAAGRLLIGAIGSLDHAGSSVHRRWASRKLGALFPQVAGEPLEFFWCGRIAMTSDHLPKVLRLGERAFSVFGYSGRGIGPGTVFGKALARVLLGGSETDLPLGAIDCYAERHTRVKCLVFEAGAIAAHFVT